MKLATDSFVLKNVLNFYILKKKKICILVYAVIFVAS